MKHGRADYARIQDPDGLIPDNEPVFLLRGQDKYAPDALRKYASLVYARGHGDSAMSNAVFAQADEMERWQANHGSKTPDAPPEKQPL